MTAASCHRDAPPRASIIIPAYNEAATVARLLDRLIRADVSIEICVVCNGCSDTTAEICGQYAPRVRVVEQDHPSKVDALNLGLQATSGPVKLIIDADIVIGADAVERLVALASRPGVDVVQPRLQHHAEDSSYPVRAFLRAWVRNPYYRTKIGAAYALSPGGVAKLGRFPNVVADDEYVRRKLFDGAVWTDEACAHVYMPATTSALIRVRSRSLSGAAALERSHYAGGVPPVASFRPVFLHMLFREQPVLAIVYAFVAIASRIHARRRRGSARWERDETSRQPNTATNCAE